MHSTYLSVRAIREETPTTVFFDLLFGSGAVVLLTRVDAMIASPSDGQQRNEEREKSNFQQPASSIGRKAKELLDEMHWNLLGKADAKVVKRS
jgi:hypothetical protein